MTPVEVLRGARTLIESPERWAHRPSEMMSGRMCCLIAICRAAGGELTDAELQAETLFRGAIRKPQIGRWNDWPRRTHTQVLAAFDRAIALAEKAGAK